MLCKEHRQNSTAALQGMLRAAARATVVLAEEADGATAVVVGGVMAVVEGVAVKEVEAVAVDGVAARGGGQGHLHRCLYFNQPQ